MKHTDFKKTFNPFVGLNEEKSSGLAFSVAIGASFLLSILFLIVLRLCGAMKDGYTETDWWRYFSFLLPQLSFAITAGLYFSDKKHSFKETAGKPTLFYIAIAVILQFGLLSLFFKRFVSEVAGKIWIYSFGNLDSLYGRRARIARDFRDRRIARLPRRTVFPRHPF